MSREHEHMSQDELKKMRQMSYIKMVAMGGIVAAVIAFSSIAWFTMNREVEGTGTQMSGESIEFDLRFKGDNIGALSYKNISEDDDQTNYQASPIHPKAPVGDYARSFIDGILKLSGSTPYYETDGTHTDVILRLDQEYLDPEKENGLSPGAGGEIVFWIVPKKTGTITVKFSLDITGYTAKQSSTAPFDIESVTPIPETVAALGDNPTDEEVEKFNQVSEQIQAVKYLRKHILFFKGEKSGNNWTYTDFLNDDLIQDGYYPMTFNATENEPIEVRFRWDWTNTFKQMVLPSSGENVPASVTNIESVRGEIQQYTYAQYADIFKDISLADVQSKMMKLNTTTNKYEFDADTLNTGKNLDDLSRGYNRADSEIGKSVDYMLLVLGAE